MKFLVAKTNSDSKGNPKFEEFDIIEAEDKVEACDRYNEKHGCGRICGTCIGEYNETDDTVSVPLQYFHRFYKK